MPRSPSRRAGAPCRGCRRLRRSTSALDRYRSTTEEDREPYREAMEKEKERHAAERKAQAKRAVDDSEAG
jgi:hypothetical protein